MELLKQLIDLFLHLDKHLAGVIQDYGTWTYAILFLIIFCETGLVVTPVLPGDSLLFAAGALSATTALNPVWLIGLLTVAAILGDTVNYGIGHFFGPKLAEKYPRIVKPEYLQRTHAFYEKYGGSTIILCRFVPIVRTFAPFVAGIGKMTYSRFMAFNVGGGLLWILLLLPAGYFFGNFPIVKKNFTLVIFGIIFLSILPGIIEFVRERNRLKQAGE